MLPHLGHLRVFIGFFVSFLPQPLCSELNKNMVTRMNIQLDVMGKYEKKGYNRMDEIDKLEFGG